MQPFVCSILRHRWQSRYGQDDNQPYQVCARCGRYRSRVLWKHVQEDTSKPTWLPPSGGY
jgi:hypothetical protein